MANSFDLLSPEPSNGESSETEGSEYLTRCYFLVVDILGFSQLISNLDGVAQIQKINDWTKLVKETRRKTRIADIQLISDTLFAREELSPCGLRRLFKFAQLLLTRGIEQNFPLRGAIVCGDVAWGELTYGKAVLEAYELERSLDWIGIACSSGLPGLDSMWDWDLVAVYPVPRKSGRTQLMPAVSWNIPTSEELLRKATAGGLVSEGDPIDWRVVSKVERTIQFGMYLAIGKKHRLNPKNYRGWFPMHIIEIMWKEKDGA